MLGLIKVESNTECGLVTFKLAGLFLPLLILKPIFDSSDIERAKFHIVGGLLSKRSDCGWLEFRQVADKKFTLVSINEFVPMLPWYIYRFTQAVMHKWTMHSFAQHISKYQ
ncbi:MAG: epimerase, partial [Bdellovibrionota bacterium]